MEEWKPVSRIPGYEVSNKGRVRSLKQKQPKLLKVATNNVGYDLVCLSNENIKYTSYIHRLVAEAFIPTNLTLDNIHVNHRDKNTRNNNVENLEWITRSENMFHRDDMTRYFKYQILNKLCDNMSDDQLDRFIELAKTIR
jgi:hypothetical protein